MNSPKKFELYEFLPFILNKLSEKVCSDLAVVYSHKHGLSIPEWRVLANLAEFETLSASHIIDFTSMEKSKVSRAVKSLCAKKLVIQKQTVKDGRAKSLKLTEKGKLLHQNIIPEMLEWEADFLKTLTNKEHKQLISMLRRLTDEL